MDKALCEYKNAEGNCFLILLTRTVPDTIAYHFLSCIKPRNDCWPPPVGPAVLCPYNYVCVSSITCLDVYNRPMPI